METDVRFYFRIYTENRIFLVYQDFKANPSWVDWGDIYNHIKEHKSFQFMTNDDTEIYINVESIIAMEISKYKFPERT